MSLSWTKTVTDALLSWPGVTSEPHRFGGIEFQWDGKEIGHMHGNRLVDVRFRRSLRDQLVSEGRAQPHHIYPDSGWVSLYLSTEEDVAQAIELLRLKYESMKTADERRE